MLSGWKRSVWIGVIILSGLSRTLADGRLLRGEAWKDFALTQKKADFYVSPGGNDRWSGTLAEPDPAGTDGPFRTIARARQAVRELKKTCFLPKKPALDSRFIGSPHPYGTGRDILVLIRGGIYPLDVPLVFGPEDGGERVETDLPTGAFEFHQLKDCYVTYASYPGETAVISGGERVAGWQKAEGKKWKAPTAFADVEALFADGKRQTLARAPNEGFFLTDGQPTEPASFRFFPGDLQPWPNLPGLRLTMVVRWASIHASLSRIDPDTRTAFLSKPEAGMLNVPPRYYVENLAELLDAEGEWFFDTASRVLHYMPPGGIEDPNRAVVLVPRLANLLRAAGSREKPLRNLRLYGLTFSVSRPGDQAALHFEYAKNCELLRNTIENVSQTAVHFGLGSYGNRIQDNRVRQVNGAGISVYGSPRPEHWNDMVRDNLVSGNEVTGLRPAQVGIRTANASRTTISRNFVSDTGSYGITVGSWPNVEETSDGSHLVEYNHVSFTNMARDDEGAIAVYGLSPGSVVRGNLIHDVRPAATNENVGFFFQNMASGWTVAENIFYNLKQAEMKLCAAYLENNQYRDNHSLEAPAAEPEKFLRGAPAFEYGSLETAAPEGWNTGSPVRIRARVRNQGSTGHGEVFLYVDGRVVDRRLFPVIAGSSRDVEFLHRFFRPGRHSVAVGTAPEKHIDLAGEEIRVLYENLQSDASEVPAGDFVTVRAVLRNVSPEPLRWKTELRVDGRATETRELLLPPGEPVPVDFRFRPEAGRHEVAVGTHPPVVVRAFERKKVEKQPSAIRTFCSATARPCAFDFSAEKDTWRITARGTDFLHAEDSYGAIFLPRTVSGNFVATVRVAELEPGVSDWFRAGIFVRNDLARSNEAGRGSSGSFLLFTTPKRIGAQWDEFGDGAMHNSRSFNYESGRTMPVWLKLVRHGNRFSGYYSFDGHEWVLCRESGDLAGLAPVLDIGLAAGTNDGRPSGVLFTGWQIEQEK